MGKELGKKELDILKEKYGEINSWCAGGFIAYFRKPNMKIWRFAMKALEKSTAEFKFSMARNCFVGGDNQLINGQYLIDTADAVNESIDYAKVEVTKEANHYVVSLFEKSCKLKPVTVEITTEAQRKNKDNIAFKDKQNMLDMMWIEGDECFRNETDIEFHMPVLRAIEDLRVKHHGVLKKV